MHRPGFRSRRSQRLLLVALVAGLLGAGGSDNGPVRAIQGRVKPNRPAPGVKDPSIPISAMQAMQQGELARAWRFANNHLQRQPRGRAGHAVLGGVESRMGWAPEALEVFDAGVGARWYGSVGHTLHANALRAVGRGAEAVALRRDDVRIELDGVRIRTYVAMVDDLRFAGDPLEAEAALAEGLSHRPRSSALLSVGADLALDRGDIAEAEAWLALIHHYAGPVRRTRHVNLRIALMEGRHELVDEIAAALIRIQPGDAIAIAAQAHSLIDRGMADDALRVLQGVEARRRGDPPLLIAEARALAALGQMARARDLAGFVQIRHPADPDARALVEALRP